MLLLLKFETGMELQAMSSSITRSSSPPPGFSTDCEMCCGMIWFSIGIPPDYLFSGA